jgi:hypothetical protein
VPQVHPPERDVLRPEGPGLREQQGFFHIRSLALAVALDRGAGVDAPDLGIVHGAPVSRT